MTVSTLCPRLYLYLPETNYLLDDITALNYALTLEHLEAYFYNKYVPKYGSQASLDSATGTIKGSEDYFLLILIHENAHVDYLTKTIRKLGGDPVKAWYFIVCLFLLFC